MAEESSGSERPSFATADASLVRELARRLESTLGEQHVRTGDACAAYQVQGRTPQVVALPGSVDDVAATLALAAELGISTIPWGSGSRMAYGYPPSRADLVVSAERLSNVLAYDAEDLTISLQSGMTHASLISLLASNRQMLPLDVPLPGRATLGGTIATGTPGLRRGLYGGVRDVVLGLRVVDASGTIIKTGGRVVKNVSGYDMSKLFTGSLGTLGMIVEANFKLSPLPETEATVVGIFDEYTRALDAAEPLDQSAVRPASIVMAYAAMQPSLVEIVPEYAGHALAVVRFPGPRAAVTRAIAEAEETLKRMGAQQTLALQGAEQDTFWSALTDFAQTATRQPLEALLRISVLPLECVEVLTLTKTVAREHGLRLAWLADAATGTVWLRAGRDGHDAAESDFVAGLDALQGVLSHRWRNAVVLDCPPGAKGTVNIWGAAPAALDLMHEVKQQFDPAHRMNPGRFLAGL